MLVHIFVLEYPYKVVTRPIIKRDKKICQNSFCYIQISNQSKYRKNET